MREQQPASFAPINLAMELFQDLWPAILLAFLLVWAFIGFVQQ